MTAPAKPRVATFDSATAMAMALGRFLDGRDFPDLGHARWQHPVVAVSDVLPRSLRSTAFAIAGAREGVRQRDVARVDTEAIAAWLASLHPRRSYPAVFIGSSSGALVHLCAAVGVPWLPQTVLVPVRRPRPADPEDACEAMKTGEALGEALLAANPGVQLHHMHDPNQDRLMARRMMYFRLKWRAMPQAYRRFIADCLAPGGTLVVSECLRSWPTTRLGERHVFQHGAPGGAAEDEYLRGSARVALHLRQMGSRRSRWDSPDPNGLSPEAEWGFEPALLDDIENAAAEKGARVVRLRFDQPDDLSPPVADLHRDWYARLGRPRDRLHVESFILLEPYWTQRLSLVPFWMLFNMEGSAERLESFLADRRPFDDILLALFAHGVDSVGLVPMERWRAILSQARRSGSFVGVNQRAYPAHFSAFALYQQRLKEAGPAYPLPAPLPVDEVLETLRGSTAVRVR